MTQIKMITLYAGPAGVMQAGEIYEVDSQLAAALIAGRYAAAVKAAPVVETADLVLEQVEVREASEDEVLPSSRRGGRKPVKAEPTE